MVNLAWHIVAMILDALTRIYHVQPKPGNGNCQWQYGHIREYLGTVHHHVRFVWQYVFSYICG